MTKYSVVKFMGVAAAGLAVMGLGGCDRAAGVLSQTLAEIKSVPVDANDHSAGTAADRKLSGKDVALLVDTARALTVGKDGVLSKTARTPDGRSNDEQVFGLAPTSQASGDPSPAKPSNEPRLEISVVDPLRMDRQDDGPPLDMRLNGVEMDPQVAMAAARRALPDVPIATTTEVKTRAVAEDDKPKSEMAKSDLHRSIQVGSFGTLTAAQSALEQLRDNHPVVEHYQASFQKVTTGSGRALVRLKLGPVDSEAQAQKLCDQLDIRDIWCHKAG